MRKFLFVFTFFLLLGIRSYGYTETVSLKGTVRTGKTEFVLSQKMFSKSDCVYIVRQNFNLKGKTILLPESVKLVFEGGSIRNGVFVVRGNPVEIENSSDAMIFERVFFRNEQHFGYQDRCCAGVCKDSWLKAENDDLLLDMAAAFDGVELTKHSYELSRDISSGKDYPNKYRMLGKSFSIESNVGSCIKTCGQLAILRQSFYRLNDNYSLSLRGFSVEDVNGDYSYANYTTARIPDKAFFGGALNNNDNQFDLKVKDCRFKGVYQLFQYPSYNGGFNVNMENVDMFCGGFGLEVYNGDTTRNLKMRVKNCNLDSYAAYFFSLINVNSDILMEDSVIGGLELYQTGTTTIRNCKLSKQITHSGPETRGSVVIDNCILYRNGHFNQAVIFEFEGAENVMVKNSRFLLSKELLENYSLETIAGRPLISIKRCPNVVFKDCLFDDDGCAGFGSKFAGPNPIRIYEDGSHLSVTAIKATKECASALSKAKNRIRYRVVK